MKIIPIFWKSILLFAVFSTAGCVALVGEPPRREVVVVESERPGPPPWAPAHGWRRKHESYHYYPAIQVYYYPAARKYYWLETGQWRIDVRLPSRYVIAEHQMVVVELDDEPHKHHNKVKIQYPPDYFEKGKGKGKGKKYAS